VVSSESIVGVSSFVRAYEDAAPLGLLRAFSRSLAVWICCGTSPKNDPYFETFKTGGGGFRTPPVPDDDVNGDDDDDGDGDGDEIRMIGQR